MLLVSHDLAVIAHMCSRIAVMQHGDIVEVMQVEQLRQGRPTHAYSKALIDATPGFE
jgi:peptide/nickel transport system ATP-binding protein